MSFNDNAKAPRITVEELLALDKTQLVRFLESRRCDDGSIQMNGVDGIRKLSNSGRAQLGAHMKDALEIVTSARILDTDALFARLDSIANGQDGSPEPRCLQSPPMASESSISSEYSERDHLRKLGTVRYHELIRNGGRPVASIEAFLDVLNPAASDEPAASHEPFLPWCYEQIPSRREGDVWTAFNRQVHRWWEFRRWQLANRGTPDGDAGFPKYLASMRREDEYMGRTKTLASDSYSDEKSYTWERIREYRLLPDEHGFTAYKKAIERQIAPHNFKRCLQLRKDPCEQTGWTTWLEYLVYEQYWLEHYTASMERARARTRYFELWQSSISATLDLCKLQKPKKKPLEEQLGTEDEEDEEDEEDPRVEKAKKIILGLINDTDEYREREKLAFVHNNRVKWIISEAHKLETDLLQKGSTVRRKSGIRKSEDPSHLADDDGITPQPWSERTRQGVAKAKRRADQDSMPEQPRRSHRKLTQGPSATQGVESSAREKQG